MRPVSQGQKDLPFVADSLPDSRVVPEYLDPVRIQDSGGCQADRQKGLGRVALSQVWQLFLSPLVGKDFDLVQRESF